MTAAPVLRIVALAAALSLLAPGSQAAAGGMSPQDAIKARQAGFKKMGAAMKAINDQFKGASPDRAVIAAAAQTIAATAREQAGLFPEGSGASAGIKTDALPNIWTERAAFDAQMRKLQVESANLVATLKSGDLDAIHAQQKATGAVCGACHHQFRSDN